MGVTMKIIIVGCGQVGETLAAELGGEGHNITVIDLSYEKVSAITSKLDIMGVVGNGAIHSIQKEAGVDKADLLIAVTDSDELNLLCCVMAKKKGKCQAIARIQNPEYRSEAEYLREELGLAMIIIPEYAVASEIARLLKFPAATQIETFAKGRVELLKFRLPENSPLVGMTVRDVIVKLRCDILICTIERGDEAHIANGDFVFEPRDLISIIASPRSATNFFKKIDYPTQVIKSAMVLGAGEPTHYLCEMLRKSGIEITVVEKDTSTCERFASDHENVIVINGDEADQELLKEEGIESADAFLALLDNDEENILLSVFASRSSGAKVISKITRTEYSDIIKKLDIDTPIYPETITSDIIIRYVRAMKNKLGSNVETMYSFIKGQVEATEFIVGENSPITKGTISELKLKKDVLIAAILRGKEVIIPRGQDIVRAGDSVVIVSKSLGLNDVSDIIAK
jgi:trk system potassium uptake protein TrkA